MAIVREYNLRCDECRVFLPARARTTQQARIIAKKWGWKRVIERTEGAGWTRDVCPRCQPKEPTP